MIIFELHRAGIVGESDMVTITRCPNESEKNSILYRTLKKRCNETELMEVCDVMKDTPVQGMDFLAYNMRRKLKRKSCLHMCRVHA